jgi:hypothetical protein
MELVLNLLWLMLALPAAFIWRRQAARQQTSAHHYASLVLLGFVLALLFPVVSATDDIHPMRAEIEESSPGKRLAKQAPNNTKSPTWSHSGELPPHIVDLASLNPANDHCELVSEYLSVPPNQTLATAIGSRAPPVA